MAQQSEENNSDEIIYDFNLYPNPNNGIFILSTFDREINAKVLVTDVLGKLVLENNFNDNNKLELNISNADKGVYFVRIINTNNKIIYFGKAIVQ